MEASIKKVGLIGVNCDYKTLYRTTAFDGAVSTITPVNPTAIEWHKKLTGQGYDLVLPLTHQSQQDDIILAKEGLFPVILGGHDHDESYEIHNNSLIVKAGADAHKACVIDVVWADASSKPQVSYSVKTVKEFPADPEVKTVIDKHLSKLVALEKAIIHRQEAGSPPLSSKGTRFHQTTVGGLLCTAVRSSLKCDAVFLDGGAVRGNKDYPSGSFTLSDIRQEFPFGNEVAIVKIKGSDVQEILAFSRSDEDKSERAGYLQADDGVLVDKDHKITQILGEAFNPEKIYEVAYLLVSLSGMNNNVPLTKWGKDHKNEIPDNEACRPCKPLALEYFSKKLWKKLPPFKKIDKDKNGYLTKEEVKKAYSTVFTPDLDKDGKVDPVEEQVAASISEKLVDALNTDGDDHISRAEYEAFFGSAASKKEKKKNKKHKEKKEKKSKH